MTSIFKMDGLPLKAKLLHHCAGSTTDKAGLMKPCSFKSGLMSMDAAVTRWLFAVLWVPSLDIIG